VTTYERKYIWETPVRFFHWTHFAAMIVLSITGIYIGNPFIVRSVASPLLKESLYYMSLARLIHFLSAITLTVSMIIRLYWFTRGNRFSNWRAWFPLYSWKRAKESLGLMGQQIRYYLFMRWDPPEGFGHNPLAALTYSLMLLLLGVEVVTGWALYGQGSPGGIFWRLFGWVLSVLDSQTIRLAHHVSMWLLIVFFLIHFYLAIRDDNLSHAGTMSSMFSGYKFRRLPEKKR
jgi:Ni/Fe-hydrogenase 1 B-type cytochrome subunit